MVIYDGIKFACLSCIRGHRSSNCNHVERPLLEVRRKGRPVSQCGYCRDLRKTRQIHAKCACIKTKDSSITSTSAIHPHQEPPQQECIIDSKCFPSSFHDTLCRDTSISTTTTTTLQAQQPHQQQECTCTEKVKVVLPPPSSQPPPPLQQQQQPYVPLPFDESCCTHKKRCSSTDRRSKKRRSDVPSEDKILAAFSNPLSISQAEQVVLQEPSLTFIGEEVDPLTLLFLSQQPQEQQEQQQATTTTTDEPVLGGFFQHPFSTYYQQSFCGSLMPQPTCFPQGADSQGESVMVTITPLSSTTSPSSYDIRTRIVTCYCGDTCACPGCLVHPYQQDMVVGSSSSSCCNGSSDDE